MANTALHSMTENTDPQDNDELYLLDDPTGTPADNRIKVSTLIGNNVNTVMDGVRLVWNSATSIDVKTGICYAENTDRIDITTAITKSSLSLSSSTWYHVYVYLSGGTPAAEVVTTAPAAWKGTAYSKTSDTSRRYVGSIKTDGSGNVYRFIHDPARGVMDYIAVANAATPFRVLNGGTATTATAVDCSGVVPVTSNFAHVRLAHTGNQNLFFGATSSTSSSILFQVILASVTARSIVMHPMTSQNIYYLYASAPTGSALVDVLGYSFNR